MREIKTKIAVYLTTIIYIVMVLLSEARWTKAEYPLLKPKEYILKKYILDYEKSIDTTTCRIVMLVNPLKRKDSQGRNYYVVEENTSKVVDVKRNFKDTFSAEKEQYITFKVIARIVGYKMNYLFNDPISRKIYLFWRRMITRYMLWVRFDLIENSKLHIRTVLDVKKK